MSDESKEYSSKNNIKCLSGCGRCCDNPDIFASPLEMLPLAIELYFKNSNKLEALEDIIEKCRKEDVCIYYSIGKHKNEGSCGAYNNRPVVCRLFGWSLVSTKRGKEISICSLLKDEKKLSMEGAPDIVSWNSRVSNIDPGLSGIMPLNKAFAAALEKVLTAARYSA